MYIKFGIKLNNRNLKLNNRNHLAAKSNFGAIPMELPFLLRSLVCDRQIPDVRRKEVAEQTTEFSMPNNLHPTKTKNNLPK